MSWDEAEKLRCEYIDASQHALEQFRDYDFTPYTFRQVNVGFANHLEVGECLPFGELKKSSIGRVLGLKLNHRTVLVRDRVSIYGQVRFVPDHWHDHWLSSHDKMYLSIQSSTWQLIWQADPITQLKALAAEIDK